MLNTLTRVLRQEVDEQGYINPLQIEKIALDLNLSKAEVIGVISFYEDFRSTKPPKHLIRICQAEACQALGARQLMSRVGKGENIEVETVSCLGLCACGPALMHNGELKARVSEAELDVLLTVIRSEASS